MKVLKYFIVLLFVITGATTFSGFSQTTKYDYDYDLSGNRIERIIDLSKSATINNSGLSTTDVQSISDKLAGQTITIYPNPTKGKLKVNINGVNDSRVTLQVFNMQGGMVVNKQASGKLDEIDLHKQPSSMYILRVSIGESTTDWKIIKDQLALLS